jgi:hypothetical protein
MLAVLSRGGFQPFVSSAITDFAALLAFVVDEDKVVM